MQFLFKFYNTSIKEWCKTATPWSMTVDEASAYHTSIDTESVAISAVSTIQTGFIEPMKTCVTNSRSLDWEAHVYLIDTPDAGPIDPTPPRPPR